MKKSVLIIFFLCSINLYAQDSKYNEAMERNISILDTATVAPTFLQASNLFERVGNANTGEWLPLYYQSYCHVMLGLRTEENSKKDEHYDKAFLLLTRADSLSPENSEIYALKGMVTGLKISIDPMTRGQMLGMQSATYNSKAIQFDKENPRAYLMKGTGLMYTPQQFGGGKAAALPILETCVEKYNNFKPKNFIAPHWGREQALNMLEQCKKME